MKTILQDAKTGLYFQKLGKWTQRPLDAHHFEDTQTALGYATRNQLPDVMVLPRFEQDNKRNG